MAGRFRCSNNGVGLTLTCGAASVNGTVPGAGATACFTNPNSCTIRVVWSDQPGPVCADTGWPILPYTSDTVDVGAGALYAAALVVGTDTAQPFSVHRGYETKD